MPYPILDFNPNNKYKKRLEDLNILLRLEEIGKLLTLNRNLCGTDVREVSLSNSPKLRIGVDEIVTQTQKDILADADERRNGISFFSMKKLFDDEFNFLCAFYEGNMSKSNNHCIVNVLNPSITYRQISLLKELYFDLEFRTHPSEYKSISPSDYNYFIIQDEKDYEFLKNLSFRYNFIIYTSMDTINYDDIELNVIKGRRHMYKVVEDKKWVQIL